MSAISQNVDGTYAKTYTESEISIVKSLSDEVKARVHADQLLWVDVTGLANSVKDLQNGNTNVANIQKELTNAIAKIHENSDSITRLDAVIGIDAYTKTQVDEYISLWKIEQIPHRIATPTNAMFDRIDIDKLQSGYVGFLHADIDEPHDNHMPENTMRRYTISAYVGTPRDVTFHIHYADRLVFILNGTVVATYTDTSGNFGGVAKVLPLNFKEGWNKVQVLVANETQRGGVQIKSNLYEQADYLSNLDDLSGMITGDRIQEGTLDESHFSPNMDLIVRTLTATADTVPGVIIGNPNGCGILQIGDKTITKCVDEPFVFDDGIRVNGYIYVSQLLIDIDFILQGDGILIEKIKDMATGFTRAYVIHNDLKVENGGGLTIVGDGRKGYTFTNAMKLDVHPDGGLEVSGDPVKGYVLTNAMKLFVDGTGGISITGNARTGYYVKNTMNLNASRGLKVEGQPWTAAGYKIKNQMEIVADGIIVTPYIVDGDAVWKYHLENDTKIEVGFGLDISKIGAGHFKIWNIMEITGDGIGVTATGSKQNGFSKYHLQNNTALTAGCLIGNGSAQRSGGIAIFKTGNGAFTIGNDMSLVANYDGPVSITGNACSGFVINAKWPSIRADGEGIIVTQYPGGEYYIKNTGVLGITTGEGLSMSGALQRPHLTNIGVLSISAGEGIAVEGSTQKPSIKNLGVLSVSAGTGIRLTGSSQRPVINTDGVLSISAGEGISIDGSKQNPVIKNTMTVTSGSSNVTVNKNGASYSIRVAEQVLPPPVTVVSGSNNVTVNKSGSQYSVRVTEPPQTTVVSGSNNVTVNRNGSQYSVRVTEAAAPPDVSVVSGSSNVTVNRSGSQYSVRVTEPPQISVTGGSNNVRVQKNGNTYVIYVSEPNIPPPIILPPPPPPYIPPPYIPPPYIPPPYIPPPSPSPSPSPSPGPSMGPGGGGLSWLGHGDGEVVAGGIRFKKTLKSTSPVGIGVANGSLSWNDSTTFTFTFKSGGFGLTGISGGRVSIKVYSKAGGSLLGSQSVSIPANSYVTPSGQDRTNTQTVTLRKSDFRGIGNTFYVGVYAETSMVNVKDSCFAIMNTGSWS